VGAIANARHQGLRPSIHQTRKWLSFTAAMPTSRLLLCVELTPVNRGSHKPPHPSPATSARPELENSQDRKRTRTVLQIYIEAHFASRKSLL
jgi:hypothetical protein